MKTFVSHRAPLRYLLLAAAVTVLGGQVPAVQADTIDILATPPDVTASVDPNIVVTFDDSGSMGSTAMPDQVSDAQYIKRTYNTTSTSFTCSKVSYSDAAVDAKRFYSSQVNLIYFNPNLSYDPPLKPDGSPFPNASFTKAWRDGICANYSPNYDATCASTTVDLSKEFYKAFTSNTSNGQRANAGGRVQVLAYNSKGSRVSSCDGWAAGDISTDIRGTTAGAFYFQYSGSGSVTDDANYTKVEVGSDLQQKFANWYAYYRTRNLFTRTGLSRVFGSLGTNIRVAWQNINDSNYALPSTTIISNFTDTNTTGDSRADKFRTKFFNWMFNTGNSGGTPDREATIRAGDFFTRSGTDLTNPYWQPKSGNVPAQELSCRQNFHMLVTDGYWNETNPSPPSGFVDVQNPPSKLPDGTSFSRSDATSRVFWDVPASTSGKCSGGGSIDCYPSLADIAFHYWATDLRAGKTGGLKNNVPPYLPDQKTGITGSTPLKPGDDPIKNAEIFYNPVNDPATWQHVVQFMVTLGVAGKLNFSEDADCKDASSDLCKLRKGQANSSGTTGWPQPKRNAPEAIDDTWHAAINSRGAYFSAGNPQELVDGLKAILNKIVQRRASATAVSVNTGVLSSKALAYSSGYDSTDWSGYMTAYSIDPQTAAIGAAQWDAGCLLTGKECKALGGIDVGAARDPGDRTIVTSSSPGKGNGVPFRWASIGTAAQAVLNADGNGEKRLDYLRGDRSNEDAAKTPYFRTRSSVLGPAVNSQPVFVSYPDSGYRDDFPAGSDEAVAADKGQSYEQFAYDHKDRPGIVYMGANDGMLHAFDAKTGKERWAYVPNTVLAKLNDYSKPGNGLVPSVDNTPVARDVFVGGKWRTLLVGSLRLGGRGVFALDITDADKVSESDASKLVMWEFNGANTALANLGYTFGAPNIGRLPNGKWAVFVAGGYFPKDSPEKDSAAAKRQQSSLFVLDAETGALIKELTTPSGVISYGLAAPVLADYTDDQVDDAAFAGDIVGNLWRFDLSSWTVDQVFKPAVAGERPITVMPRLFPDPVTQRLMVVFGTGKYLGADDRLSSSAKIQAFYGIRDVGPSDGSSYPAGYYPVLDADLRKQTLKIDGKLRELTDASVNAKSQKGWTFDLPAGERNITTAGALFNSNRAILVTIKPSGDDPCDPSRKGAITVIDAANGGPADGPPVLPGGTNVRGNGDGYDASGYTVVGGEVSNPPTGGSLSQVNRQGGGEIVLPGIVLDDGTGSTFSVLDAFWRRRSWRELLQN